MSDMMTNRQKNYTHFCSASRESKGLGESNPRPEERGEEKQVSWGDDAQVVNTAGLHYKDHSSHSKWDDRSHTVRQIALTFLSTNTFVSRT